ncbi:hypothetical protein BH11BAC1_BH11BAC1_01230 [soil metagenome]
MKTTNQIKSAVVLLAVFFSTFQIASAQAPLRPGTITGNRYGACNLAFTYSVAPVANATGYTWTAAGATIVNGQNTETVLISFPVTPLTITVSVVATNASGSSPARSVGIHGKPAVPGTVVATPSDWCAGTNGIQFFSDISMLTGIYSLQWSWNPVPAAGNATGLTSNLLTLDWLAQTTHGVVRLRASNSCGISTSYYTTTVTCGPNPNRETNDDFTTNINMPLNSFVYPNPTQGNISLKINSEDESAYNIKIVDIAGRIILDEEVNAVIGENEFSFDLTNAAKGIYSVLISGNNISEVNRISLQ